MVSFHHIGQISVLNFLLLSVLNLPHVTCDMTSRIVRSQGVQTYMKLNVACATLDSHTHLFRKGKVIPVLNQASRHEDTGQWQCRSKHY
jgi:hypothetical protein